ncbi:MAG: hypothetical protein ACM3ZU_01410 [Bacteroidota bacterium]
MNRTSSPRQPRFALLPAVLVTALVVVLFMHFMSLSVQKSPLTNGPSQSASADTQSEPELRLVSEQVVWLDRRLDAQEALFQASVLRLEKVGYLILFIFTAIGLLIGLYGLNIVEAWIEKEVRRRVDEVLEECVHRVVDPFLAEQKRSSERTQEEHLAFIKGALDELLSAVRAGRGV